MTKKILIARKDVKDTLSAIPKTIIKLSELFHEHDCLTYVIAENINRALIKNSHATPVSTLKLPLLTTYQSRLFYAAMVQRWRNKNRPDLTIGHGDIIEQDVLFMHNCVHKASELIHEKPLDAKSAIGRIHDTIMTRKRFKVLICNSQLMLDDFSARYDLSGIQTAIIHPELNTQGFSTSPDEITAMGTALRSEYGLGGEDLVIGLITSGDFVKRNVANAIKAFAQLPHARMPLKLFIAGKNETQPYKTLAAELGIADKVIFAPAIPDVQRYYYAVNIFMLPAFIEEFGKSVLEAMYCRKPVVIGKYVGAAEILPDDSKKYIINDVRDPAAIAASLLPLIGSTADSAVDSAERRKFMGEANHQASLQYTSEKQMQQYYNLFKPMLEEV